MREGVGDGGGAAERDAGSGAGSGAVWIDGARGEGGGQILRTSLALSMITGRPLRMERIRAGRAKPGLRRQHLACVHAAAALCGARVRGDRVGSQVLAFDPGPIGGEAPAPAAPGWLAGAHPPAGTGAPAGHAAPPPPLELDLDIGTAGSTSLVVQTILVPAIASGRGLVARVSGGTHNPLAPPFDFIDRVFAPHLRAMGAEVELTLERHGFAVGGTDDDGSPHRGRIALRVGAGGAHPGPGPVLRPVLRPIELLEAGPVVARRAEALLSRLPTHVGERELGVVRARLGFAPAECRIVELAAGVTANALILEVERAGGRELVTQLGERGLRAEVVAARACDELEAFLRADVPVGEHLADQLLLPLAVAGGGRFRCAPLSSHATTNIDTIRRFLDVPIHVEPDGAAVIVSVG